MKEILDACCGSEMIKLFEKEPLLYNKRDKTHWIVYYKGLKQDD